MKIKTQLLVVAALLSLTSFNAMAVIPPGDCDPDVRTWIDNPTVPPGDADLKALDAVLRAQVANFATLVRNVSNQATYQLALTAARTLAAINPVTIPDGRVVITLPNGTTVIDTSKPDDPNNLTPTVQANSYNHFIAKTVNENHNSRMAIHMAQFYQCGTGAETDVSTSVPPVKTATVAIRLGGHLRTPIGTISFSLRR